MSIRSNIQIAAAIGGTLLGTYLVASTLQPPSRKSSAEKPPAAKKEFAPQQEAPSPSTAPSPRLEAEPGSEAEAPEEEQTADSAAKAEPERFVGFPESPQETTARLGEQAELLNRWDGETHDADWTGQIGDRIRGLLSNAELQANQLEEVDCRESICRFQLATDENTHSEVMSLIHVARDLTEETWIRAKPDEKQGESRIEVFLPKEGFRLSGGGGLIEDGSELSAPPQESDSESESG